MVKPMKMNAFAQCCVDHHSHGQWRNPAARSQDGYRNVHYWTELARTLERGFFDALFLADVHGTYDVYKGSADTAIEQAVQIPGNDPTLIVSAMAAATRNLGFACTYSTTYFAPYHTAKLFSTLDHLTDGRVAWNVVTSYLKDALDNFGLEDNLTHDQRYDRADEYMDVVYKLWEHSWEDGAIVRDAARGIYTDPARVHRIDHEGEWFKVPGPHMCEPSPQRTPVIYQAGASGRGVQFGAKHAAGDLKIIQGVAVIVAPTDEEARIKERTYRGYASREAALALFSGWAGIDLAALPPGTRLEDCEWNAIQSLKHLFRRIDPDREWTLDAIGEFMEIGSVFPKIIGSPATVADELERWMDETDVDGFNVHAVVQPAGFTEFVDMVVPELQRRGRMREAYEGSTLRENYFGAGHKRLKPTHAAFKALPPWKLG